MLLKLLQHGSVGGLSPPLGMLNAYHQVLGCLLQLLGVTTSKPVAPKSAAYLIHGSGVQAGTAPQALAQRLHSEDQILVLPPEVVPQQTLRTGGSNVMDAEVPGWLFSLPTFPASSSLEPLPLPTKGTVLRQKLTHRLSQQLCPPSS